MTALAVVLTEQALCQADGPGSERKLYVEIAQEWRLYVWRGVIVWLLFEI